MTQVVSNNGNKPVITRHPYVSTDIFQVKIQYKELNGTVYKKYKKFDLVLKNVILFEKNKKKVLDN